MPDNFVDARSQLRPPERGGGFLHGERPRKRSSRCFPCSLRLPEFFVPCALKRPGKPRQSLFGFPHPGNESAHPHILLFSEAACQISAQRGSRRPAQLIYSARFKTDDASDPGSSRGETSGRGPSHKVRASRKGRGVQFNAAQRELTLKVVYYGPALSGKTTNLRALHAAARKDACGRLMTLDTADDRTLFFDLLPLFWSTRTGLRVKIKLFTVPGQVMHDSTRRIVLAGADAVAFIADAQPDARQSNFDYWQNMVENLKENGLAPDETPIVIQYNKCDLLDLAVDAEIRAMETNGVEPVFRAVAVRGVGVVETFRGLMARMYDSIDRNHDIEGRLGMTRSDFLDMIDGMVGASARVGGTA